MSEFAGWYEPEHEVWSDEDYFAAMINGAKALAEQMDALPAPVRDGDIDEDFQEGLDRINEIAEAYGGLTLTFSGEGTGPGRNFYMLPDSVYGHFAQASGELQGFELFDHNDFPHVDSSYLADSAEAFYDDDSLAESYASHYEQLGGMLKEAPEGLRLCAKFLAGTQAGPLKVAGAAFEAPQGVNAYYYVDVSTLSVAAVEALERSGIRPEELFEELLIEAGTYQTLLNRDTVRNRTAASQDRLLGDRLTQTNQHFKVEQFDGRVRMDIIYSSLLTPDGISMSGFDIPQGYDFIPINPQGLDVLERIGLADGLPYGLDGEPIDGNSGLCLVAEIDNETKTSLGLQSPVIWIPVGQAGFQAEFDYRSQSDWF